MWNKYRKRSREKICSHRSIANQYISPESEISNAYLMKFIRIFQAYFYLGLIFLNNCFEDLFEYLLIVHKKYFFVYIHDLEFQEHKFLRGGGGGAKMANSNKALYCTNHFNLDSKLMQKVNTSLAWISYQISSRWWGTILRPTFSLFFLSQRI